MGGRGGVGAEAWAWAVAGAHVCEARDHSVEHVRPVRRQRLAVSGGGDGVRRRAGYRARRRSEAGPAHREQALRDGAAAHAAGQAAARLAGEPLVRCERCAQRLLVLRGAGAGGALDRAVLALARRLAVEAEAGRVARRECLRQRGVAQAARRGGVAQAVHRVAALRERVRFRRHRGDGVEPVPAKGALPRDGVGLGFERLGLVPKVLAVALERAERAQPDAAIAHIDVPARLRRARGVGVSGGQRYFGLIGTIGPEKSAASKFA